VAYTFGVPFELTEPELAILDHLSSGLTQRETYLRLGIPESQLRLDWQEISIKMQSAAPETLAGHELLNRYQRVERQRLEAELWASEARLSALMDTAPEAVLIIEGRSGRIVRVNSQTALLFGYTPRELIGRAMEILIPDDLKKIHVAFRQGFLSSVRKREIGYHPLIMALRKDGTQVPLEIGLTATASTDDVMVVCRPSEAAAAQSSEALA
jgi:PAS domain S-box-containing protein